MGKQALVIGGGFGGLSAAALLARDGFTVTVVEKNEQLGGRARYWHKDGFTAFDTVEIPKMIIGNSLV